MSDFLKGKVTPQDWLAVLGILGAAALIAGFFFFVIHARSTAEFQTVVENNRQTAEELAQAEAISAEFQELQDELAQIEQLVADFDERLPTRQEIRQLIQTFENLASQAEVRVDLSPGSAITDQRKETIPYYVTAYGTFHQIASFINRLERYERYLKVSDLVIEEQSEAGVSEATFTLSTYRFIEQPEPAQTAQARPAAGAGS